MPNKSLKNVLEETIIFTEKGQQQPTEKKPATKTEPFLIQLSGRETGQNYRLTQGKVRIGRDSECDICVDDPHVSRVHACVEVADNKVVMKDLGSTNGIFINGSKVDTHVLRDGDKVLVGTRLYFRFAYQDAQDQDYQQNLFRAANMDALTQLYNKKYFLDVLPKEMSFSRRSNQPLSLMMLDVDHFKALNDTHGHLAGDKVLKMVGKHLSKHVRLENVAARYGGEEFAVILRNCGPELGHTVAERLRTALAAERVSFRDQSLAVTVSIGIATFVDDCFKNVEDFIHQADAHLYEAKNSGRNKTVTSKHRSK